MTLYEVIVACVACTNLLFNFWVLHTTRSKAAAARVDQMSEHFESAIKHVNDDLRRQVADNALRIERLDALTSKAPNHDDLAAIYEQINTTREIVSRLAGEQEQMNINLRLLITQLVNRSN